VPGNISGKIVSTLARHMVNSLQLCRVKEDRAATAVGSLSPREGFA
jgi:hypothetical protein